MYNSVNHASLNYFPIFNHLIWLIEGLAICKQPNSEYYNFSLLKIWSKNCHNFLVIKIHCLHRLEKKTLSRPKYQFWPFLNHKPQAQLFVLEISMTTCQTQLSRSHPNRLISSSFPVNLRRNLKGFASLTEL